MPTVSFGVQGGKRRGVRYELRAGTSGVRPPVFDVIEDRMKRGTQGPGGKIVATVMRRGAGSTGDQFKRSQTLSFQGDRRWRRTRRFGNVPPPKRTLVRSGNLERAWTGGSGSTTRATRRSVTIGVDTSRFPQSGVFQSRRVTVVRAKRMGKGGRSRMHWFLGLVKGAWISDTRLRGKGLRIHPRRVGVNRTMTRRAIVALREFYITGGAVRT